MQDDFLTNIHSMSASPGQGMNTRKDGKANESAPKVGTNMLTAPLSSVSTQEEQHTPRPPAGYSQRSELTRQSSRHHSTTGEGQLQATLDRSCLFPPPPTDNLSAGLESQTVVKETLNGSVGISAWTGVRRGSAGKYKRRASLVSYLVGESCVCIRFHFSLHMPSYL